MNFNTTGALLGDGNTAVTFNGTSDYISVPTDPALHPGDTFSLVAWWKRSSNGTIDTIIDAGANDYKLSLGSDDKVHFQKSGVSDLFVSTATYTDSAWHLLVATKATSTIAVYVDGASIAGTTTNATIVAGSANLTIGAAVAPADYFAGALDEVAVFSTALSSSDVTTLWTAGTIGTTQHPMSLEVNGIDWIASVDYSTIAIEMAGPGTNGSMTFTLSDPTGTASVNEWDEVRFIEHAAPLRPIAFGGFVQAVRYVAWATTGRDIEVTCVGYGILLDKKIVPSFAVTLGGVYIEDLLVSLVGRFGGRVVANHYVGAIASADETYSMPSFSGNWATVFSTTQLPTLMTLRGALEYLTALGQYPYGGQVYGAAPGAVWVDSAAMVRVGVAFPDDVALTNFSAWRSSFEDLTWVGLAVSISDVGGDIIEIDYERESSDRATSAYVSSSTAAGTGYWRDPGLERAGDLETLVSDDLSVDAASLAVRGAGVTRRTDVSTERATVVLRKDGPVALFPGQAVLLDIDQVNLVVSSEWRITAVRIAFQNSVQRTYSLDFGHTILAPSMTRRQGRFRPRGY